MTRLAPCLACLLLLALAPGSAAARTVDDLLRDGHLSLSSRILPDSPVVPGQKLQLVLTVATDTWFAGGTRITVPEMPGLVILQNEQFAANASENRDGKAWVIQRWTLDVFPQRAGSFTVGPVKLRVEVNGGSAGNVAGVIDSPPVSFEVTLPEALQDVDQWLASPRFTVRQRFDRDLDALAVGDAIEQEVVFEASDVMAMMLPAYTPHRQEGLAAYPEPPTLDNSINRGELTARRQMRISYVAEAPGEFVIPEREFFWWDTGSNALKLLSLPQARITVTGTAGATADATREGPDRASVLRAVLFLAALAAGLLIARAAYRLFPTARFRAALCKARHAFAEWRRPALPAHLNPGHVDPAEQDRAAG